MAADKDDPNRLRKALVGGATGAVIGGLTGALAGPQGVLKEDVAVMTKALDEVPKELANAESRGYGQALSDVTTKPDLALKLVEMMTPEARELVAKGFDKGWLARMLGG